MSPNTSGYSTFVTVAILIMVLASTPIAAMGYSSGSARSGLAGDTAGSTEFTFNSLDIAGCVEFTDDSNLQCEGVSDNKVTASSNVISTEKAGKLKLEVESSITSGFTDGDYSIEMRADNGTWAKAAIEPDSPTILSVENSYRLGSIQYPTVYARVIDDSTGNVVAFNSMNFQSPVTIPTGDESWNTIEMGAGESTNSDSTKRVTVVGSDGRSVNKPSYRTVSRFNDNDARQEAFEDKSLPPVRYDRAGAKVSGPQGNLLYFDNLRSDSGLPAILRHSNGKMKLGTAIYGIDSSEYQKIRIDYGLQTESINKDVQVNLVNSYGEPIDPTMTDAPSRRLSQTTGKDADYFTNRKQYENALYEENLNTNTIEFELTSAERDYIENNNDLYITYSVDDRAYLLLYRTPIIGQSIQNNTKNNFVPDKKIFEESFNENPGAERTATFDAEYRIAGPLNSKYDTLDHEPNEDVEIQVRVDNKGDERVERRIGVYSQSEKNTSLYGANADPQIIDQRVVGVEPHSTKTVKIEYDYEEHEYGNHDVTVVDTTDPDNPTRLIRERDEKKVSQIYVLQPATFKVRNVITPESWLIHDNFNTTVVVQNVGDLNGTGVLTGEFQDWSGQMDIPNTRGGNVRENANGSYANITFHSQNHQYSPSYPERPANGNNNLRPNSPFGSQLTYSDNLVHKDDNQAVDVRSKFDATTSHPFAKPNELLHDSLNHTQISDTVRIYKLDIVIIRVDDDHTNDETWYASGYSYTNNSANPYWSAWKESSEYDIFQNPVQSIPTLEQTQFFYPPYQVGDSTNPMDVTVEVKNTGQANVGDARIKIRTTKLGLDGGDNGVVGVSGSENFEPFEMRQLHVPVVLRNDAGNGGTQTLSAEVRTQPDYIQRLTLTDYERYEGEAPDGSQFSTDVNVNLWADFIHLKTTTPDNTINEHCSGWNPSDTEDHTVNCDPNDAEGFYIDQFHKNYGGESGKLTVDAFIETERDPSSGQSEYSDLGYISDPFESNTNYWADQTIKIGDNTRQQFNGDDIAFDEPGVYRVKSEPHRVNYESGELDHYNDTDYAPAADDDQIFVKILDITTPESDATISDTTYGCKSGTCDGQTDTWGVHQGATVEFDNQSVDNVVVDWINWEGTIDYNGGEKRCHGADHCYSDDPDLTDNQADKIVHRFEGSNDETVRLRVRDHPAYGHGASLNSSGTPNEETEDFPVSVKADTEDPSVLIYDSYHNNPDNSPDSTTVWHTDSSQSYDGIEVCFASRVSEDQIGIEADDYSDNLDGVANEDTRCRTWSESQVGPQTVRYTAWDFAGNKDSNTATIEVKHDSTPPTISDTYAYESGSGGTSECVSPDYDDDETGIYRDSGDQCHSYNYESPGNTAPDPNPACEETETTSDTTSDTKTFTGTVTAEDYHGNTVTESYTVAIKDSDTDTKTATGGPCPPPPPPPDGSDFGGGSCSSCVSAETNITKIDPAEKAF